MHLEGFLNKRPSFPIALKDKVLNSLFYLFLMDKKLLMQLLVIGVVIIFLLETLSIAMLGSHRTKQDTNNFEGLFKGKIKISRYYPVIFAQLDEQQLPYMSSIPGVVNITNNITYYTININSSRYVPYVYLQMYKKGIEGQGVALITIKEGVMENNSNITFPSTTFQYFLEPIYYQKEIVPGEFYGGLENGRSYINSVQLFNQKQNISFMGNISLYSSKYLYYIPWQDRTLNYSVYGAYVRKDYFRSNITKNVSYVINSAGTFRYVNNTFADKELVLKDFPDAYFPDSVLASNNSLNLSFNYSVKYYYTVNLPQTLTYEGKDYYVVNKIASLESNKELESPVNITAEISRRGFLIDSINVIGYNEDISRQ